MKKILLIALIFIYNLEAKDLENQKVLERFAFGSCNFQWDKQEIWKTINSKNPQLFIFNGDAIYSDFDGKGTIKVTPEILKNQWNKLKNNKNYMDFSLKTPIIATWDNHDYGKHDGGVEFHLKDKSQEIFLDFFKEPKDSKRRNTKGVYDSKIIGPKNQSVQIILLDERYFKTPYTFSNLTKKQREEKGFSGSLKKHLPDLRADSTILGQTQWEWLEKELQKPAKLRFIVTGTQIIPDEKGMQEWGNFPKEREKFFNLISKLNLENVIILSGNVHFSEISELNHNGIRFIEFTSSGMTHTNKTYSKFKNSYRIRGPFDEKNFGYVEIDWSKENPLINLKSIDSNGNTKFELKI